MSHNCAHESLSAGAELTKTLRSLYHSGLTKIMPCCRSLFPAVDSSKNLKLRFASLSFSHLQIVQVNPLSSRWSCLHLKHQKLAVRGFYHQAENPHFLKPWATRALFLKKASGKTRVSTSPPLLLLGDPWQGEDHGVLQIHLPE